MIVERQKEYRLQNLLVCEGSYEQTEIEGVMRRMENVIISSAAHRVGPTVSATFAIHDEWNPIKVDVRIMIPIDKKIVVDGEFYFMPEFLLEDVIKVRHMGNPVTLQRAIVALTQYMDKNHLKPNSVSYNVAVKEAKTIEEMDNMIVDIYVAVSNND